jgi:predicted TIM-barrel fold metal-dependent hydrolase
MKVLDADAHVIEPFGIFGDAQRLDRNPMDLPPTTPTDACGGADLTDQWEHAWDAASYIRAMDRQGIDAAVLYPSVGLFVPFQPEISTSEQIAACAGYDEWIAGYCAHDPSRLAGVGIAPLGDPHSAAAATRRAADAGIVGMLARPNFLHARNLGDGAYDPFYDSLEETQLILAVHEGMGVRGPTISAERFTTFAARHLCSHPMEQMAAMASLILDGALERHPTMRVAFLESGTGWLPYWLARLDDHIEWMADSETSHLTLSATEYFLRQCCISTDPEDPLCATTVDVIGADHVIWASDFPHPDAAFPDAVDEFTRHNPRLDPAALESILWDTPLDFYRLADRFNA